MKTRLLGFCLLCCLLYANLSHATDQNDSHPKIENKILTPPLLFLKGTPYELGYQHGESLKEAISYNIKRLIDDQILAKQEIPQIKSFLAMLPQVIKHIPQDYIEELKGLADGSQIAYEKILLLNLFPEMFHCSGLTVKGKATKDGDLYHVRVLDYAVGMNLQDTAVQMIVQPQGKIPFLNVSYAGFIGTVTGMNGQHIAVGEIGGKGYGQYDGMPMAFLLRRVLEQASTLQEVKNILANTPRTCEYYYVFSDGKTKESIGVYATSQQLQFIEPGTAYALFESEYLQSNQLSKPVLANKVVLKDSQITSTPYQTLLYQDSQRKQLWGLIHHQPEDCLILTGFCHTQRYPMLIQQILARYGQIEVSDLQEMIKGNAGLPSNLHTAIFAPATLDVWVAHAGPKGEAAWSQPYTRFNLTYLLGEVEKAP